VLVLLVSVLNRVQQTAERDKETKARIATEMEEMRTIIILQDVKEDE
jgi:hypothetical protein